MYHWFRLKREDDLKKEIETYVINHNISGVVLSCVGCLGKIKLRLADGKSVVEKIGQYEIVSITGTLSVDGVHIHLSVSDESGITLGGHLKDGCLVNTTAEICLLEITELKFNRKFDKNTGYKELVTKQIS